MRDYHPNGMAMWDTWALEHDGVAHMFHLQRLSKGSTRSEVEQDWLGHCISTDLVHWTECPLALGPHPSTASLDDRQPWTGCVYEHAGRFYLYYTMRSSLDNCLGQRIGLALSDDLYHWERYPGNPVIVPDERWYIGHSAPLPKGIVDCRDLIIQPDPNGEGWIGCYAASIPGEEYPETTAFAAVRSTDLLHWEHLPPAFAPKNYGDIEVPDIFALDGRWYMTGLTGHYFGTRGMFSDPHVISATMYAVADRPEGPYHEIEGDNVLIGGDSTTGYSCRSLIFEGKRYVFYTQPGINDSPATLSPPMELRPLPDGRLRAWYSPRTQAWRNSTLIASIAPPPIAKLPFQMFHYAQLAGKWALQPEGYVGKSRTGWQVADLGIGTENLEMEARITVDGVAAGLVYRPDAAKDFPAPDMLFALDAEQQTVFAASLPTFGEMRARTFPVQRGRTYHLRVCIRRPRVEVYVDDQLMLQFAYAFPETPAQSVALFVDRGQATISELAAYTLGDA